LWPFKWLVEKKEKCQMGREREKAERDK